MVGTTNRPRIFEPPQSSRSTSGRDLAQLTERPSPIAYMPSRSSHEGPVAHLRRVIEDNGLGSINQVLRQTGWDGTFKRPVLPSSFAQSADGNLAGSLPRSVSRNLLVIDGQTVHKAAIGISRARICPACLREDGISHGVGEYIFGTACPRHRKRPYSRMPSMWDGSGVGRDGLIDALRVRRGPGAGETKRECHRKKLG